MVLFPVYLNIETLEKQLFDNNILNRLRECSVIHGISPDTHMDDLPEVQYMVLYRLDHCAAKLEGYWYFILTFTSTSLIFLTGRT